MQPTHCTHLDTASVICIYLVTHKKFEWNEEKCSDKSNPKGVRNGIMMRDTDDGHREFSKDVGDK